MKNTTLRDSLLTYYKDHNVLIEGPVLKLIQAEATDIEYQNYIRTASDADRLRRTKRLKITKELQSANTKLQRASQKNNDLIERLTESLEISKRNEVLQGKLKDQERNAKEIAMTDLDVMQRRTQFKLMTVVSKMAIAIIASVTIMTTAVYLFVLHIGSDSTIIENTWSNMFGILLTNSFSILGTILGIRYATTNRRMTVIEESYDS